MKYPWLSPLWNEKKTYLHSAIGLLEQIHQEEVSKTPEAETVILFESLLREQSSASTRSALKVLRRWSADKRQPLALFGFSATPAALMVFLLLETCGINLRRMGLEGLTDPDFARLTHAVARLSEGELLIDRGPFPNLEGLCGAIRKAVNECHLQTVAVDPRWLTGGGAFPGSTVPWPLSHLVQQLGFVLIWPDDAERRGGSFD